MLPTTSVDHTDGDRHALSDAPPTDVADSDEWPNRRIIGAYLDQQKEDNSHNTYKSRRTQLRRFHAWLRDERDEHVTDVDSGRLKSFLEAHDSAGYRPNTVTVTGDGVKAFYGALRTDFGVDVREFINGGAPTEVKLSNLDAATDGQSISEESSGKKRPYVTKSEKEKLLDSVPEPSIRNKLIIQLLWETGFRRSTLANVSLGDVDRDRRRITVDVPKTGNTKTVTFSTAVADLMETYVEFIRDGAYCADSSDALFLGYRNPLDVQGIGNVVREAAERAGIQSVVAHDASGRPRYRVTAHKLRHGLAHHLLHEKNFNIEEVRDQLGHSDISVTQTYVEQEEDERLAAMREKGPAGRTESL